MGALEFVGAVPRIVVPDNVKSGVTKACWYNPELNPSYLELARHFSVAVLPTRPYHPRDKAARRGRMQFLRGGVKPDDGPSEPKRRPWWRMW